MISSVIFFILLAAATLLITFRVRRLVLLGNAARLTCEIYYPVVLVTVYGLAAVPLIFQAPSYFPSYVGVDFTNSDVLYAFSIMMLGALSYFVGFNLAYRAPPDTDYTARATTRQRELAFNVGAVGLAAVDLMVRLQQIATGQYFDWMRGRAADLLGIAQQNPLWLLQDGLAPILAAIAIHRSKTNRVWLFYLIALFVALVLEGKRTKVYLAAAAVIVVLIVLRRIRIRPFRLILYGVIGTLSLGFASSAIMETRIAYRSDMKGALENPAAFVEKMTFEILPQAFVGMFTSDNTNTDLIRGASLSERLPTWTIAFTSAVRRVEEVGHLPAQNMSDEMSMVVPSVLWIGDKPSVGISTVIANKYDLWPPSSRSASADLASTALVNPYLYYGLPGLIVYALILGVLVAWTARFAGARLGANALLLLVGSIYYLKPLSNSMGGPFVGLRNLLIIVVLFAGVEMIMRVLWRPNRRAGVAMSK